MQCECECSVKKEVEKCDDPRHSCKLIMIGETHNEISNFTITLIYIQCIHTTTNIVPCFAVCELHHLYAMRGAFDFFS